jgi:phosphomannomutase
MQRLAEDGARCPVGYEANGGFLLGAAATRAGRSLTPLPTRDAMLPILAILTEAAAHGVPLSVLAAAVPPRFTASDRLPDIPAERSDPVLAALATDAALQARLAGAVGAGGVTGVDTLDGIRLMLHGDEIVHLRASGNAPELRCYAEADRPERAADMVGRGLKAASELMAAS